MSYKVVYVFIYSSLKYKPYSEVLHFHYHKPVTKEVLSCTEENQLMTARWGIQQQHLLCVAATTYRIATAPKGNAACPVQ